jgi:hypothetical protein
VTRAKVQRRILLSAEKPKLTKRILVTLENRGEIAELIRSEELSSLLGVEISSELPPGNCAAPVSKVIVPWFASPPYAEVIGLKPKGRLALSIDVTWECTSPFSQGLSASRRASPERSRDRNHRRRASENDVCPRASSGDDKGCGAIRTDLTLK